jgi:hypothetical protein
VHRDEEAPVRILLGIVVAVLVGLGLSTAATVVIVEANAPDNAVEANVEGDAVKEPRQVVQYGQR